MILTNWASVSKLFSCRSGRDRMDLRGGQVQHGGTGANAANKVRRVDASAAGRLIDPTAPHPDRDGRRRDHRHRHECRCRRSGVPLAEFLPPEGKTRIPGWNPRSSRTDSPPPRGQVDETALGAPDPVARAFMIVTPGNWKFPEGTPEEGFSPHAHACRSK